MQFQKSDLIQIDNLIKIIRRGQYTLDGPEVLAASDCMKWLDKLQSLMTEQMSNSEVKPAELKKK